EHRLARVDAGEVRAGMELEHATRRLAGADAELEDPLGAEPGGRARRLPLELDVVVDLLQHRLEVALGPELELGHRRPRLRSAACPSPRSIRSSPLAPWRGRSRTRSTRG